MHTIIVNRFCYKKRNLFLNGSWCSGLILISDLQLYCSIVSSRCFSGQIHIHRTGSSRIQVTNKAVSTREELTVSLHRHIVKLGLSKIVDTKHHIGFTAHINAGRCHLWLAHVDSCFLLHRNGHTGLICISIHMLILITHIHINSIRLLCQIRPGFHLDLNISGPIFCHLIYKNSIGTCSRKEGFIGCLRIFSLYCRIKLKKHIVDTGSCRCVFQMKCQHKAITCMYHFWICLKTSHDHSRGGCFSICTHTCGTAGLNIRIQGSGLTASVRCKISYIKGNLLISIPHIASGLKIPGQFPAAVHIRHTRIGSRKILNGLRIS